MNPKYKEGHIESHSKTYSGFKVLSGNLLGEVL